MWQGPDLRHSLSEPDWRLRSIRDGEKLVCVDTIEGPSQIRIASTVGKHFCLHSTCTGKVILAYLPESETETLLGSTGLTAVTPNTITSMPAMRAELSRIRVQGYAVDDEENTVGIRGVAAAVFNHESKVVAAIAAGAVGFQLADRIGPVSSIVRDCARSISEKLGFRESALIPVETAASG